MSNDFDDNALIDSIINDKEEIKICENFILVPLRISGSGITKRKVDGDILEYNRPIDTLFSDTFKNSCIGSPVIIGHPSEGLLNDNTIKDKAIKGSIVRVYQKENELWGVAKIYDMDFVKVLNLGIESTSPAVKSKEEIIDGIVTEIEMRLNHLAIVPVGYWDNGDVAIIKEFEMADEIKEDVVEKVDAVATEKIDKAEEVEETKVDKAETTQETKEDETITNLADRVLTIENSIGDVVATLKTLKTAIDELTEKAVEEVEQVDEVDEVETEDDREKDEVIETVSEIADSADCEVRKVKATPNLTKCEALRRAIKHNKDLIDKKYHGFADKIDSANFAIAKEALLSLKNNVMKKKAENCKTDSDVLSDGRRVIKL